MNKFLVFSSVLLSLSGLSRADEGMWLLNLLSSDNNYVKMKEMGLMLSPEQIYSINHSSLKDAIGVLDENTCTAELVSPEGLILTNHHCGHDDIQNHSSIEHNYLKNGFWAMTREEELPNEDKTISFVVRIEDVTDQVLPFLGNNLNGREREDSLQSISGKIIKKAVEGTHYEARVKDFFYGNKYLLIVLETFKDVRLVGAPPESIGNFGKETDNWMWPRHTGDFSIFRVYTGPDGKPASYSPENIPLKSKHFLPVSLNGYEKGDFAMILGFPGTTDRYKTSFEINEMLEITHPNRILIRGKKQEIMLADMHRDEAIDIMYSSKYSESMNYWKYSIGQVKGLERLQVIQKREALEKEFTKWMEQDADRIQKYGKCLEMISQGVDKRKEFVSASQYLVEGIYYGIETVQLGNALRFLYEELREETPVKFRMELITRYIRDKADRFFMEYNNATDKKITTAMLYLLTENVAEKYLPSELWKIQSKYKGRVEKYVEHYFKKSILTDKERFYAFLDNPSLSKIEKDPGLLLSLSFFETYTGLDIMSGPGNNLVEAGSRLWMEGLMEMNPEIQYYPEANSSLRFSYGKVCDYQPRDAVYYSWFTSMKGILEKEIPGDPEFSVDEHLKELYLKRDFGKYGENGEMKVCFLTNHDTTGGNSGSPVINGNGELIGISFDGNWESMSGDVMFEKDIQMAINVDIRYVLFVIDKFAGAGHLVQEMTLVE